MLERLALLIKPWAPARKGFFADMTESGTPVRTIHDPETDRLFGFALWKRSGLPGLLSWLSSRRIQVFESDDASLLTILVRPIGIFRVWRVLDAVEHKVGGFHGAVLFNQYGDRLAILTDHEEGQVFQADTGLELGWVRARKDRSLQLRFNKYADKGPFIRMVMLASLIGQPPPV